MANNGEIIIRIITSEEDGDGKVDPTGKKEVQKKQKSDLETAAITKAIEHAAKQVFRISVGEVQRQLQLNFSLTDNYIANQNLSIGMGMINKGISTGFSIFAGFKLAGPAGAAIGAGVEMIKLGLDIYHNYQEEEINLRKMENQLSFQRERAGYSLTAGTRGENR